MIRIKRIYDPIDGNDGYRILVDRLWPRGVSKESAKLDLWMRDIAPSDELRKWFHHDSLKWDEFQVEYKKELILNKELLFKLKSIEREYNCITLLYSAKDREHNQANVIAEILDSI